MATTANKLVILLLSLSVLTALGEVDLVYNSSSIANNTLLSFSDVGEGPANILTCSTPSLDCCESSGSSTGVGLGDWYLPSGVPVADLVSASSSDEFYVVRRNGSLDLYRRNVSSSSSSMEGIYSCEVPNNGVNSTLFVGIYPEGDGKCLLGAVLVK